jgi:hypothetical protein
LGHADFGNGVLFPAIHGSFSGFREGGAVACGAQDDSHRPNSGGIAVNMVHLAGALDVPYQMPSSNTDGAGASAGNATGAPQETRNDASAPENGTSQERKRKEKPPSPIQEDTARSIACELLRQSNAACSPAKIVRASQAVPTIPARPRTHGERMLFASREQFCQEKTPRLPFSPRSIDAIAFASAVTNMVVFKQPLAEHDALPPYPSRAWCSTDLSDCAGTGCVPSKLPWLSAVDGRGVRVGDWASIRTSNSSLSHLAGVSVLVLEVLPAQATAVVAAGAHNSSVVMKHSVPYLKLMNPEYLQSLHSMFRPLFFHPSDSGCDSRDVFMFAYTVYKLRHLVYKPPPFPVPAGTPEARQLQASRASLAVPLARALVSNGGSHWKGRPPLMNFNGFDPSGRLQQFMLEYFPRIYVGN